MRGPRYLILAAAATMVLTGSAQAATIAAANCSNGAIQTAINSAADGDTVTIPSCASTAWSGNVTVPNTKGIAIQGAGSASTAIDLNGHELILQTTLGRKPLRVTGIRFNHRTTSEAISIIGTAQNWRIDNNVFDDAFVYGVYSIRVGADDANVDSYTFGVIDHNQFLNRNYGTSVFVEWGRGALDPVATGDWVWSQAAERGTAQAVYIEDNVFGGDSQASQVVDARWGAKYVLRYNTILNPWISTHSGCTNWGRDPIWVEIYKNNFSDTANHYVGSQIEMRSVSGVVFGNTSSATLNQYGITIDHERSYRTDCAGPYAPTCNGTTGFDLNSSAHGYVCLGQPGWGQPQASDMRAYTFAGLYAWGNRNNGTPVDLKIDGNHSGGYTLEHLQAGREFFNASNMTSGPRANRPSTCSAGPARSVYVSTDENAVGATIYVCSATNTWTKQWEPYTYPHPLTTAATAAPRPPTNVRMTQ